MTNVKVIGIEENPELVAEATELLLRTANSEDTKDNADIDALIERILKYIQDEENPLIFQISNKAQKSNVTIQLILYRPVMDGIVEKLYSRKWEIKKRCKDKVNEIHIKPNEINILYEEG